MANKRILILATYPIAQPQDGGQKRAAAIVKEYSEAFGSVKFVAIFKGRYPKYRRGDIYVATNGGVEGYLLPFAGDVIAGEAVYNNPSVRRKVVKLLASYKPDIIQLEQPFLYLGLRPLLEELDLKPKLVLSSYNVEYPMKEEILRGIGVPAKVYSPIIEKIRTIEETLCRDADIVLAVSKDDADLHKAMGAGRVVVAPNGIERVVPGKTAVNRWRSYMHQHSLSSIITFVGSAHPPNWVGFMEMVGMKMGFLAPSTRLFLAGSISDYFRQNVHADTPENVTFWQRVVPAGRLSDNRLAGLIAASDALILPITEGGGSNLKTAEAILSGKRVVATSYAFRSFEQYLNLPNIYIADTANDFRGAMTTALQSPLASRTAEQVALSEQVQWRYCLQDAIKEVSKL